MLLLAVTCVTAATARVLLPSPVAHERHAGCHQHGPKNPDRPPANYACCAVGHGSAILPSSFLLHTAAPAFAAILLVDNAPQVNSVHVLWSLQLSPGDPPGRYPLRI